MNSSRESKERQAISEFPEFVAQKQRNSSIFDWKKYKCDICDKTLNGNHEWQKHIVSNRHKKQVRIKEGRIRHPRISTDDPSPNNQNNVYNNHHKSANLIKKNGGSDDDGDDNKSSFSYLRFKLAICSNG